MSLVSPGPSAPFLAPAFPDKGALKEGIVSDIERGIESVQPKPKPKLARSEISPDVDYLVNAARGRAIGPYDMDIGPLSLCEGDDAQLIALALAALGQAQGGKRPLGALDPERVNELVISLAPLLRGDVSATSIRFGAVRSPGADRAQLLVKLLARGASAAGSLGMRRTEAASWVISDIAVNFSELGFPPSPTPGRFEPELFQTEF
jgi:hypothetical protein